MTKSDLIDAIAAGADLSKAKADEVLNIALETIKTAITKGDAVQLVGFGGFSAGSRAARMGRNPKTGEEVSVPARRIMFFTAGKDLKDRLNGKKAERKWTHER